MRTEAQEQADIRKAMRGAREKTGIFEAPALIRMAVQRHASGLAVSWSGGRCSTAVLRLAMEISPGIKTIFGDTGVEYPETIEFVKRLTREWNVNLIVAKPSTTFWKVCEKYGFPYESRVGRGKPACCRLLKEYPLRQIVREHGIKSLLTGMRVAEARNRMFWTEQRGQFYFTKKYGLNVWKYNPIAFWSSRELAEFEKRTGIPLNPIYSKYALSRSGCWPCTGFKDWRKQLARTNPQFYAWITKKVGPQRILEHFFTTRLEPCQGR